MMRISFESGVSIQYTIRIFGIFIFFKWYSWVDGSVFERRIG